MAKNIMLIFLSDIKSRIDNCEVVISDTKYTNVEGENTHITNESAIRYLQQNYLNGNQTLDKIFVIASKKIREGCIETKVKDEIKKFLFDGKTITHIDYFKQRMKKFLTNSDTCITDETIYPYEENSGDVKNINAENLKYVAKFAGHIQDYAAQVGEKVILHADLSGGMRHINMMMLDVIRLLEYSDIEIGKLLYSNYNVDKQIGTVEEVKDIYDLFQLISGVEEFVQFGSAKALQKYYNESGYKDKLSAPLKNLIDAMENFAEAIKLCHYGQFSKAIENLHDAVHDFEANPENVQDILMSRLIGRIRKDYKNLISQRNRDDLRIIRWCIENGYMQQALTLYTERIPEYIGDEIGCIGQSKKEAKILDDSVANDPMHHKRWFYLLNVTDTKKNHIDKGKNKYCSAIKDSAMQAIRKNKFDYDSWWKNFILQLEKQKISCEENSYIRSQLETFVKLRNNADILIDLSNQELDPIRAIIKKLSTELNNKSKGFERSECIFDFVMTKLPNDDMDKFFAKLKLSKIIPDADIIAKKYPHAFVLYEKMFDKIFYLKENFPLELFLKIMERYCKLKDERNHSNHAHEEISEEFPTAQSLKKCIEEGLDELEEAKKIFNSEVI